MEPEGALAPLLASARRRLAGLTDPRRMRRDAELAPPPRDLLGAVRSPGVAVIAEMKRSSPSAGALRPTLDCRATASGFAAAGAAAISVLTEPDRFLGSLADLERARAAVTVPVLRKDFVVDPLQVLEARAAGADAVLLIVRALGAAGLRPCLEACRELGMAALVEVHTESELLVAADLGAELIGINNRDLDLLVTDLAVTERLARLAPPGSVLISESGIRTPSDLATVAAAGVHAVLVGEALMRAADPRAALAELTAAGAALPVSS